MDRFIPWIVIMMLLYSVNHVNGDRIALEIKVDNLAARLKEKEDDIKVIEQYIDSGDIDAVTSRMQSYQWLRQD